MNEDDCWVYFDGPEPARVRDFLDALRDLPPETPEEEERADSVFFEKLAVLAARKKEERRVRRAEAGVEEEEWLGEAPREEEDGAPVRSSGVMVVVAVGEARRDAPVVVVEGWGSAPEVPVARAPAAMATTSMAVEIPAEARVLPFRAVQPGEVPAWTTTAKTEVLPVMGLSPGQTAGVSNDALAKALQALPFTANSAGRTVAQFPRLTVEAFASLQAELAVNPEDRATILPRYGVKTEAGFAALVEEWGMLFAARPGERAAFEEKYAEYAAWLWKLRLRRVG